MSVEVRQTGQLPGGHALTEVEITSEFMTARLLNLGATLWQLASHGPPNNTGICLFHDETTSYARNVPYFGSTVGPVGNRIASSAFSLDGQTHDLIPNEGDHHLHGGPTGFSNRVWETTPNDSANSVTFALTRPDGDGGYPGNLRVEVTWTLERNCLMFEWTATTDKKTPVSLTNHTYWNLAGAGSIDDHHLRVDADRIVAVDNDLIPTGELADVIGTPFDLNHGPRLGDLIPHHEIGGIDHCYALRDGGSASLSNASSGLQLDIQTSLPGIQVYTGHQLNGSAEQGGYGPLSGVCLETQFFPDAVNRPHFASPLLEAGETMHHRTTYIVHGIRP